MDLIRLGGAVLPRFPPAFALTSQLAAAGLPVPVGAILLSPTVGPLRPGEQVDLRGAALRGRPALPLSIAQAEQAVTGCWEPGGLLLTRAVPAVHGGTAVLDRDEGHDRAVAFELTKPGRAAGEGPRTLLVPQLRAYRRPHRGGDPQHTPLPPWGMRLARLIRAARPLAAGATLEWADDGARCWLLLAHPAH